MDEHLRLRRFLDAYLRAASSGGPVRPRASLRAGVLGTSALLLAACAPGSPAPTKTDGEVAKPEPVPPPKPEVTTAVPTDHVDPPPPDPNANGTTGAAVEASGGPEEPAGTGGSDPLGNLSDGLSGHPTGHSCPSTNWCTSKKVAKSLASSGTKYVDGCAESLDTHKADGKKEAVYDTPRGYSYGMLDTEKSNAKDGAGQCCYQLGNFCGGGRPLTDSDGLIHAPIYASSEGLDAHTWEGDRPGGSLDPAVSESMRLELLAAYRADAMDEWSSVASFARAAIELMIVGAPPRLVAACQAASLDEVRHATLCLELAGQLAGQKLELGALTRAPQVRHLDLESLALAVLREGCVEETLAAMVADRCAHRCTTPSLRDALQELADDEAQHAALAWETLDWAIATGGEAVRARLQQELPILVAERSMRVASLRDRGPGHARESIPDSSTARALRLYGRVSDAERADVLERGWYDLVLPMLEERGVTLHDGNAAIC